MSTNPVWRPKEGSPFLFALQNIWCIIYKLMIYIGLDNGGQKFGLSILNTETKEWFGTTITRTEKKSDSFNPNIHPYNLWDQIQQLLQEKAPTSNGRQGLVSAGIEKFFLKRGRGKEVLPWMQGFIAASIYAYYDKTTRVTLVGSQEWKKELIGFRTNGKEFVEEYVKRQAQVNKLKINITTKIEDKEDTYDAMGISYFLWRNKKLKK